MAVVVAHDRCCVFWSADVAKRMPAVDLAVHPSFRAILRTSDALDGLLCEA